MKCQDPTSYRPVKVSKAMSLASRTCRSIVLTFSGTSNPKSTMRKDPKEGIFGETVSVARVVAELSVAPLEEINHVVGYSVYRH